ncbi:MAG: Imm49 family immunity protein [bacterium]
MGKVGNLFEETASCFQALGICNLLLSLDLAGFSRNLIFSGYTRRYFLNQSRLEGNISDEHLAISRNESFFDAIAAGAVELAREIADLSFDEWMKDGEYEDDFCYYLFFHNYLKGSENFDRAFLKKILARFEKSLERSSSGRLSICCAFYTLDQRGFEEGFQELVNERQNQIESYRLSNDLTFEPKSHVFVEGLALLRIAEKAGFPIQREYQYCPAIARVPASASLPGDIYGEIERIIHRKI